MSDFITSLRNIFQGPNHRWWALSAVECGNFLVYMDAFIVTLALPAIARQFSVGIHEVKWVMLAYLISLTISLMLAGRLGDRFGRKLLTQAGLVTLVVGAALCLVATSLEVLIACRCLQGAGAAMVLANVMAEITALFPKAERRRAMACNASVLAAGQVVGLLAGGALIDSWGWRSVFAVIAGIGCIGLVLGTIILRNRPAENPTPFDLHGAWLSLLVVGLPFLLIERLSSGLSSVTAMLYLTGSLVLLAIFILVERNHPAPLLNPRLFRLRAFVCGSCAAAAYFVAAGSSYFLIPLYAQTVMGFSPFEAGLLMLPLSLALTVASQFMAGLSRYISARVVATLGLLCTSAGVLGLSFLSPGSSLLIITGLLAFIGAGGGLFHPPNNTSVLAAVPVNLLGSANGFFTTSRNFGQALGVAIAATAVGTAIAQAGAGDLLARVQSTFSETHGPAAFSQGQAIALRLTAAIGLIGAAISAFRGPPINTAPPETLDQKQ